MGSRRSSGQARLSLMDELQGHMQDFMEECNKDISYGVPPKPTRPPPGQSMTVPVYYNASQGYPMPEPYLSLQGTPVDPFSVYAQQQQQNIQICFQGGQPAKVTRGKPSTMKFRFS